LVYLSNLVCDARWFSSQLFFWVFFRAVDCEIFTLAVLPKPHYLTVELPTVPYLLSTKHLWAKLPGNSSILIYECNTGLRSSGNLGDPSLSHIFKMWGRHWLNLRDLINRKETPPSRRLYLFKNPASGCYYHYYFFLLRKGRLAF
jgi:hypothetical protein